MKFWITIEDFAYILESQKHICYYICSYMQIYSIAHNHLDEVVKFFAVISAPLYLVIVPSYYEPIDIGLM